MTIFGETKLQVRRWFAEKTATFKQNNIMLQAFNPMAEANPTNKQVITVLTIYLTSSSPNIMILTPNIIYLQLIKKERIEKKTHESRDRYGFQNKFSK